MNIAQCAAELSRYGTVKTDVEMSAFTTFKTGGKADLMIYPSTIENAAAVIRYARSNAVGVFVFEMFDEPWKTETGEVGPHWGVFDSHGRAKFALPW